MSPRTITSAVLLSTLCLFAAAPAAHAEESTIERPGLHPRYPIEIEPHVAFGWQNVYGNTGVGAGLRLSVPVVQQGFVSSIDDNVAISFGADLLHYDNCYFADRCGANYLLLPVTLQWNFFLSPHWSVFGEPGLYVYRGFFDSCAPGDVGCRAPSDFGLAPAFFLGGRYQMTSGTALALRIGYPTTTFGVSFL